MSADPFDTPETSASHNTLAEQKMLGKYQIEKKVGAGGMGAVYLARDTQLRRAVALKILPKDKAENPTLVKRFRAEAQAAAQLRHDNVVMVYETGEIDGFLYIAMEFVDGVDVHDLIFKRGRIPVKRSIEIIKQTAAALQHAYEQSIVHRDIKPSNLLIRRDGVVKLTDLGLARSVDDTVETNITRAGTTVGTVDYMSPEQARDSKAADIRSDLYSLGCTWYHMLTGQAPFSEGSLTNKLQAHATKPPPDPRSLNPDVTESIVSIMHRLMAKKQADRYQTPKELIADLNRTALTKNDIANKMLAAVQEDDEETVAPPPARPRRDANDATSGVESRSKNPSGKTERPEKREATARGGAVDRHRNDSAAADDDDYADSGPHAVNRERNAGEPSSSSRKRPKSSDTGREESRRSDTYDDGEVDPPAANASKGKSVSGNVGGHVGEVSATGQRMPGRRKTLADVETPAPAAGADMEWVKIAGYVTGGIVALLLIGFLISQYSRTFITGNAVVIAPPPGPTPPASTDSEKVETPENPVASPTVANTTPQPIPPSPAANPNDGRLIVSNPGQAIPKFDWEVLPKWVEKVGTDRGTLVVFTVGPGAMTKTHFNTLAEAIQKAPAAGAVIRLLGNSIYPLPPVSNLETQHLVLTANRGDRPVISFVTAGEGQTAIGLKCRARQLELEGVHLAFDRGRIGNLPASVPALIEACDAHLTLRNCSLTVTGPGATRGIVLEQPLSGTGITPTRAPRILLENVVARGPDITLLTIVNTEFDAVIRNTLIATGTGSALKSTGNIPANPAQAELAEVDKVQRSLRLWQSTFCGSRLVLDFEFEGQANQMPAKTALSVRDCVFSAGSNSPDATLLKVGQWPQRGNRNANQGKLIGLSWWSRRNVLLGFGELANLGADSAVRYQDLTKWQTLWAQEQEQIRIDKGVWPADMKRPQEIALSEFAGEKLPKHDLPGRDGISLGCDISRLIVPDSLVQQRVNALSLRPRPPVLQALEPMPPPTLTIDLSKEDLGQVLIRPTVVNGAVLLCRGKGICNMSPVVVRDKSLILIFQQQEGGAPLVVMPKVPETVKAETIKPGSEPEALLAVVNGALEIRHGQFAMPLSMRSGVPRYLLAAHDANLIVRETQLWGPGGESPLHHGLIFTEFSQPPESAESRYLLVQSSMLVTPATAIRADSAQGRVYVNHSLLATRGEGISLNVRQRDEGFPTTLDLQGTSISAGKGAIRFTAATPGQFELPARAFVDRCAFLPAILGGNDSALLSYSGKVISDRQLDWWGQHNAVAPEVKHWLRDEDAPATASTTLADWTKIWSGEHDQQLLQGPGGVLLAESFPTKWPAMNQIKPSAFTLHINCKAATWAEGGHPVGANLKALESIGPLKPTVAPQPVTPTLRNNGPGF